MNKDSHKRVKRVYGSCWVRSLYSLYGNPPIYDENPGTGSDTPRCPNGLSSLDDIFRPGRRRQVSSIRDQDSLRNTPKLG